MIEKASQQRVSATMVDSNYQQAAGIRRAQINAQKDVKKLNKETLKELKQLYQSALWALQQRWTAQAGGGNQLYLDNLQAVISDIDSVFLSLYSSQQILLAESISSSIATGTAINALTPLIDQIEQNTAATRAVWQTTRDDGFNLSQRLWKLNVTNKNALKQEVQFAVIRGDSAFKASRDFIEKGMTVPTATQTGANASTLNNLNKIASESVMTGKGNALYNAQRLFITEIVRAHNQAYLESVDNIDGIIGYKFNLSSAHKKTDICDLHAKANLYGLGRGVYPKKVIQRIYPAHPQTTSSITAVWDDEVTEEDKKRDKNRISWLKKQSKKTQDAILGKQKGIWLRQGKLTERTINSKVSVLKKRLPG